MSVDLGAPSPAETLFAIPGSPSIHESVRLLAARSSGRQAGCRCSH